jgi:hypothetical protein
MVARSLYHRLRPSRPVGVTAYYRDGLDSRLAAARWQLDRHPEAGTPPS